MSGPIEALQIQLVALPPEEQVILEPLLDDIVENINGLNDLIDALLRAGRKAGEVGFDLIENGGSVADLNKVLVTLLLDQSAALGARTRQCLAWKPSYERSEETS